MDIEKQVCSLELAKQLKELGVKQESLWYWENGYREYAYGHKNYQKDDGCLWRLLNFQPAVSKEYCSAFTVAELGEMLPWRTVSGKIRDMDKLEEIKIIGYWCDFVNKEDESSTEQRADTEADARAKMLVYLLENRLIGGER